MACSDKIVSASNMKGDFISAGFQLSFFLLSPDIAQKSQIFHAEMLFFSPKLSPTHESLPVLPCRQVCLLIGIKLTPSYHKFLSDFLRGGLNQGNENTMTVSNSKKTVIRFLQELEVGSDQAIIIHLS